MTLNHTHFFNAWFWITMGISIFNIGVGLVFIFEEFFAEEMATGWLVSLLNYCLQWIITRDNRFKEPSRFFIQWIGLNGLRAGIFFITAVFFLGRADHHTTPFMYSLFSTYFIFLTYTILNLQFSSIRTYESDL